MELFKKGFVFRIAKFAFFIIALALLFVLIKKGWDVQASFNYLLDLTGLSKDQP